VLCGADYLERQHERAERILVQADVVPLVELVIARGRTVLADRPAVDPVEAACLRDAVGADVPAVRLDVRRRSQGQEGKRKQG
jgi:hypothetical protein